MKTHLTRALAIAVFLTLAACGGGGGSTMPPPPPPSWGVAQLIETNNLDNALDPQIAVDAAGNAIAVWQQSVPAGRSDIWANRYTAATGTWGTPELIETDNTSNVGARAPQVAIDAAGNAIAVWFQSDGTRDNIMANRYVAGVGWGTAELIETDNAGDAEYPQIAVDPAGNALAVWDQSDGTRFDIWANRYVAGAGWGAAERIETGTGDAFEADVGVDAAGNALAVWYQFDGTYDRAMANRYTVGTGWGAAAAIETGPGNVYFTRIAVNATGDALAAWLQFDGSRYQVWANRYTAGQGWGTAAPIENGVGDVDEVQIAIDAAGDALAVWRQFGAGGNDIWANRYTVSSGWGTAVQIETASGNADGPQVAIDSSGNAIAIWNQSDGTRDNIWASRYTVSNGWDAATPIETEDGNARGPQIAFDPAGTAFAVWIQDSASRPSIWANIYR